MTSENKTVVVVKGFILNNGKALIIKRAADVRVGGGTWELTGGKINFGEDLEAALVREINEEVGLKVKIAKILFASSIQESARQIILLTYLCKCEDNKVVLSKEHTDFKWVRKEQLKRLLPANIINDFEKNHVFSLENLL